MAIESAQALAMMIIIIVKEEEQTGVFLFLLILFKSNNLINMKFFEHTAPTQAK